MSRCGTNPRSGFCQLCEFIIKPQASHRRTFHSKQTILLRRTSITAQHLLQARCYTAQASPVHEKSKNHDWPFQNLKFLQGEHASEAELEKAMSEVRASCKMIMTSGHIPLERDLQAVLTKCEAMAKLLIYEPAIPASSNQSGASALLDLEISTTKKLPARKPRQGTKSMMDELSRLAYSVIKHPPVFIDSKSLALYVGTQASLRRPETLPEVLNLYAHKPVPVEGSSPIRYSKQNPDKSSNCIPTAVADAALQSAIESKQLVVAMDIIEASFTTTAFRRDKFVKKLLVPTAGIIAAPAAAYTLASQFANFQTTMDHDMATNVAFAGIIAYLGFTVTMGVIAITTANDQMDRVTWAPGVPLRQRWMREEERAALDKVAGAWGFREVWKRGEEEGEDWEALREWINRKAMMLDRVELMEGME